MSHVQVDVEKLNLNRFSDEDTKAKVVKLVLDINCRLDMSPPYLQQFWKNVLAYFPYMPEQHAVGFLQDQMNRYFLSPLSHGHLSGSMEVQPSHGSYLGQQFVSSDRAQRWGRGAPLQHQSWGMMAEGGGREASTHEEAKRRSEDEALPLPPQEDGENEDEEEEEEEEDDEEKEEEEEYTSSDLEDIEEYDGFIKLGQDGNVVFPIGKYKTRPKAKPQAAAAQPPSKRRRPA